ncbi:bifunctional proline dehydrogenase/L-glutamate gamma-semialdehyde dehydrogenase PutA [Parasphingorhabdus halotolerans]|uniref:Bifunctional protein PutA n=1 Tax=Parasphingorhabdus halotolerans TaxID=2725558 RepID=A0A6H2DJD3_9SPHN|nr:bifunctional proline dehydrogenase/L-glutamate gamma-semialdehyde dehydrogenase PutA [Parasphingorhabdus halotolerans]QJB68055.1 bifunctional proline dehydrogenase/L-glutamate gamma-semialdehyde dehydrogenase PutA [Parasphingorhabdus halotolerans]
MNQHNPISSENVNRRNQVATATSQSESVLCDQLTQKLGLNSASWSRIETRAIALVEKIRSDQSQPLIDQFLNEYGLSTPEGAQLMRLAEALSRTTDAVTADELIRDKIAGGDWLAHTGAGRKIAMRASGRALDLTSKWLRWSENQSSGLSEQLAKLGNSAVRSSTRAAIKAVSSQFVFAEDLNGALKRAKAYGKNGYLFSFDMLGEAARTQSQAANYYQAYADALERVAQSAGSQDPRLNHGISIKLSALHPRYEFAQAKTVVPEIAGLFLPLAKKARSANVQITIDAEEAERLDISMDVLAVLVAEPELRGWNGLGFVVQAYQRRALPLLNWLETQAAQLGAPLFIRLVKGAYWDSEIKRAQEMGLESYPVYTRKEITDLSYLACAKKLLAHPDAFSPQFATHNAHSIAAIQEMAGTERPIEVQRLFGMGQQLHDIILQQPNIISRIYAPVGTQKDLLSYLIRRLLENGANSSFVHKLADPAIEAKSLSQSPVDALLRHSELENPKIGQPRNYLKTKRMSAEGWDLSNPAIRQRFESGIEQASKQAYVAGPVIDGKLERSEQHDICNPANKADRVGICYSGDRKIAKLAIASAQEGFETWSKIPANKRAAKLERAADLLEERASVFHYLAIKEAGKTWSDAVDEVREAIDFCRYYAERARDDDFVNRKAVGVVICISPWNFPLAIFMGQVTAALAAGNSVVAKPAEQTPLIAAEAIRLLHDAGIPPSALNFVPGAGSTVGEALVSHNQTAAVCFTGSTATAKNIARKLAASGRALTPLIAETGGINAMIVDSSALLEQTIDAVVSSAFQSAGQRCSALRILCVQEDVADAFLGLLRGAMESLTIGDPMLIETDIGPVIDEQAKDNIRRHIDLLESSARRCGLATDSLPSSGHFIAPVAFELNDFTDLSVEVFGPVLHIVRYAAHSKMALIDKINASGYGLTLGIQSRIDNVSDDMAGRAKVGNIYINRNQIGAVVGVQPFGGEGLSGTGPKAGGPLYLHRLSADGAEVLNASSGQKPSVEQKKSEDQALDSIITMGIAAQRLWANTPGKLDIISQLAKSNVKDIGKIIAREMASTELVLSNLQIPSPVGETNSYSCHGRGLIISIIEDENAALIACIRALVTGNSFLHIACGAKTIIQALADTVQTAAPAKGLVQIVQRVGVGELTSAIESHPIGAIIAEPDDHRVHDLGVALANRAGPILPILTPASQHDRYVHEKTITRNIAAAGGDVNLLNG